MDEKRLAIQAAIDLINKACDELEAWVNDDILESLTDAIQELESEIQ